MADHPVLKTLFFVISTSAVVGAVFMVKDLSKSELFAKKESALDRYRV